LTRADLIDECPVVTVNRAIDVIDHGITVDFCMFADSPVHLMKHFDLARHLVPPIQLWCPRSAIIPDAGVIQLIDMVPLWEPYLPASVGIRTTPFGVVQGMDGVKRYMFGLLAAIERVLMFRPKKVRILCADMMGPWAAGLTEAECEMQQSKLEQHRRSLGNVQKKINESKGKDQTALLMRNSLQGEINELLKTGDPVKFKRWEHEREQLKALEARAKEIGVEFEYRTPQAVLMA
jgi:hypothetical protein